MATIGSGSVASYTTLIGSDAASGRADQSATYPSIEITPPVAAVASPTIGSTLAAKTTPLVIDVTDASTIKRVIIYATFSDGTNPEMVYDGTSFTTAYDASSARSVIGGGYEYSVVRDLGWRTNPTLYVYALDDADPAYQSKNELNFTSFAWVFTPDVTGPAIAANTPGAGTTLATKTTSLVVDVTDSSTIARAILVMQFGDSRPHELAWNGSAQQTGYTVSTAGISGGTRYTITRTSGWRTDPKVYLYATDQFSNETLWGHVDYVFTPDGAGPTEAANTPSEHATVSSKTTAIVVDVTDPSTPSTIIVMAKFTSGEYEVVHDGSAFTSGYNGSSTRNAISNGYRFSIVRDGVGWLEDPVIVVYARDSEGNETNLQTLTYDFTPPIPALTGVSPVDGAALLLSTSPASFTIVDGGTAEVALVIASYDEGISEVVWDSVNGFTAGYGTSSTVTPAGDNLAFVVRRDGGWYSNPSFRVIAVNE